MDVNFWLQKWERNEIGFHEREANPLLVEHFNALSLKEHSRIFLPLCGKTLDIAWLLAKGFRVVGVELSRAAIDQLFLELDVAPLITRSGSFYHYQAENIDIYAGDFFALSSDILGKVDAVYDRAALVALPEHMRHDYSAHLIEITHAAPQLLLTFEYDQSLLKGPPFSLGHEEIKQHYHEHFQLNLLKIQNMPGGLKGKYEAMESVWLLTKC